MASFADVNGNTGFKAFGVDEDRQDIFYFFNGQLFHTAIKVMAENSSIQSEIFNCIFNHLLINFIKILSQEVLK